MFNLFKKKEVFTAPVAGTIIPLEEVKDPVFSAEKMMGDGFAVVPSGQTVYAPMSRDHISMLSNTSRDWHENG